MIIRVRTVVICVLASFANNALDAQPHVAAPLFLAARAERVPPLWIPVQLGAGICAGPGAETDALLAQVREWVARGWVDSAFGSQVIRAEDVVPESRELVCRNLAEAYAKLPGEVFTPESVNVVRLGTRHLAMFDPNVMVGNARSVMIFDSTYVLKETRAINLRSPAEGGALSRARPVGYVLLCPAARRCLHGPSAHEARKRSVRGEKIFSVSVI